MGDVGGVEMDREGRQPEPLSLEGRKVTYGSPCTATATCAFAGLHVRTGRVPRSAGGMPGWGWRGTHCTQQTQDKSTRLIKLQLLLKLLLCRSDSSPCIPEEAIPVSRRAEEENTREEVAPSVALCSLEQLSEGPNLFANSL